MTNVPDSLRRQSRLILSQPESETPEAEGPGSESIDTDDSDDKWISTGAAAPKLSEKFGWLIRREPRQMLRLPGSEN